MDLSTSPFPVDWLEDETLHSISVRHVLLAGRHSLRKTVKALFSTRLGKIDCHFQDHLDTFVAQTKGLLGNGNEIIRNHTVLPSFTRFMDPQREEAIVAVLRAPRRSQTVSQILRDSAHAYPKQRHLRMCDQCVADDERLRGFAHWRRTHQLPGVYRCMTHHAPLRQIWTGEEASGTWLHLPVSDAVSRWQTTLPIDERGNDVEAALHQMAAVAREIVLMPPESRLRPVILAELYRARLDDRGLMTGRRVLRGQADSDLLQFAGALDDLPNAQHWLSDGVGKALITRMVSPTPVFPWPILHTIFIAWLFTSWDDFLVAYKAQLDAHADNGPRETAPPVLPKPPKVKPLVTAARKAKFEALLSRGLTRHAAAKQAGASHAGQRAWAAAAGVAVVPLKTALAVREDLERLLKEGSTYPAIAKVLEISAYTVADFLAVNPAIKQARRQAVMKMKVARQQRGLALARASWAEALQRSRRGDVGATRLVAKDGHFFRTYDPRGYEKMMAAFPHAFSKRPRLPDLHSKDQLLATAITQLADELRTRNGSRAVNTWDIVRALEAQGLFEKDCERLQMPLAKQALKQALKKR